MTWATTLCLCIPLPLFWFLKPLNNCSWFFWEEMRFSVHSKLSDWVQTTAIGCERFYQNKFICVVIGQVRIFIVSKSFTRAISRFDNSWVSIHRMVVKYSSLWELPKETLHNPLFNMVKIYTPDRIMLLSNSSSVIWTTLALCNHDAESTANQR